MPKLNHLEPVSSAIHFAASALFMAALFVVYSLFNLFYYLGFDLFKAITGEAIWQAIKFLLRVVIQGGIYGLISGYCFAVFYNWFSQKTGGLEYGTDNDQKL